MFEFKSFYLKTRDLLRTKTTWLKSSSMLKLAKIETILLLFRVVISLNETRIEFFAVFQVLGITIL